jgi:hypothetical protein
MDPTTHSAPPRQIRGGISVHVALAMTTLLAMAGLAIDVGYAYQVSHQLQNIADSGSMAGTSRLGEVLASLDIETQSDASLTNAQIEQIRDVAASNALAQRAGNRSIVVDPSHFQIGSWDFDSRQFTPTTQGAHAVRLETHRSEGYNGAVGTVLLRTIGFDQFDVSNAATAVLLPLGSIPEGKSVIPVGISRAWFDDSPRTCDQPLRLHPTGDLDGCAGWHTYDQGPANASLLADIIVGLTDGSYEPPELRAGDIIHFTGGTVASAFDEMEALWEERRFDEAPFDQFEATLPVYDRNDCSNPSGPLKIAGFASVIVTGVQGAPEKTIESVVRCEIIAAGLGGGEDFGTRSTTPGLVR